ncbi:MAG: hypothetical protein RI964_2482 [Pseudomonadota bacterium]
MNLFFDTSALVKYFHIEAGSQQVIELMEHPHHQVWVSDLARVEFISALYRKLRRRDLNEEQLQDALAGFDEEWARFNVHPLNEAVVGEADRLLRQKADVYGLRALDALQFASFRLLVETDWAFVVADGLLADAVASDGFTVIKVALP